MVQYIYIPVKKEGGVRKRKGGQTTTCSHTIRDDEDGRAAVCYYIKGKITSSRESVESSQFFGRHIHATTCCRSSTHIVKIFKRKYRQILFGYIFYLLGLVSINTFRNAEVQFSTEFEKGKIIFF